jgi:hypothetical protein
MSFPPMAIPELDRSTAVHLSPNVPCFTFGQTGPKPDVLTAHLHDTPFDTHGTYFREHLERPPPEPPQ